MRTGRKTAGYTVVLYIHTQSLSLLKYIIHHRVRSHFERRAYNRAVHRHTVLHYRLQGEPLHTGLVHLNAVRFVIE